MNRDLILENVNAAFSKILEHTNFKLDNETTAADVDGWESVTHMLIINEIEKTFNIKFKLMVLMGMNNVGDLLDAITAELNSK
jgi:acyl carrier protein